MRTVNMSNNKMSLHILRITTSAVFLSIALVLKTTFSFYIPMFGQNGMSVGISGIFSIMPSILFGPLYGAIVSGLSDFMGYLLKPTGAYLPLMTLVAAAGGFIRGALWMSLRNRSGRKMRIAVAVVSIVLLTFGFCNIAFLSADGVDNSFYEGADIEAIETDGMHAISKLLITRTIATKDPGANLATYLPFVTSGVIGSAVLGLVLLLADLLISKKFPSAAGKGLIMPLLIAMIASGLIVTTINTVILQETIYASWKLLPFGVVWIPRAIEEILGNTVKAYFVALLLGVFESRKGLRNLVS